MRAHKITTEEELEKAFLIRNEVFVKEQQVAPEEEYDEYDKTATHFIAYDDQHQVCGTARWRKTNDGIKLERFAVLGSHRGQGAGAAILLAVLKDIDVLIEKETSRVIYLHAQTSAIPFYLKHGFQKVGEEFEECNIKHFKMIRA